MYDGGNFGLAGTSVSGQTLAIDGQYGTGDSTVTAAGGFTNGGQLTFACHSNCGGGNEILNISAGTLTNTGTITTSAGNTSILGGPATNTGTMQISTATTFQAAPSTVSATLDNQGAINISTGTLSTAQKIVNDTGGSIAATGLLTSSGVFDQGAGTTSGQPVRLTNGRAWTSPAAGPAALTCTTAAASASRETLHRASP